MIALLRVTVRLLVSELPISMNNLSLSILPAPLRDQASLLH